MHLQETIIEHDQAFLRIEHHEAVRHVLDRGIESCCLPLSRPQDLEHGLGLGSGELRRDLASLRLHAVLVLRPPTPDPVAGDQHDQNATCHFRGGDLSGAAPPAQGRVLALRGQDEQRIIVEYVRGLNAHLVVDRVDLPHYDGIGLTQPGLYAVRKPLADDIGAGKSCQDGSVKPIERD